jgi:1-aminocyclopropane-1-carboxylate deaminase/D-cysteine desulfhydrase-like pyridoxal-dependent ACC family enzyme
MSRLSTIKKVVSGGGHQSNLMLAAAYLAKDIGVPFEYYTKSLKFFVDYTSLSTKYSTIR